MGSGSGFCDSRSVAAAAIWGFAYRLTRALGTVEHVRRRRISIDISLAMPISPRAAAAPTRWSIVRNRLDALDVVLVCFGMLNGARLPAIRAQLDSDAENRRANLGGGPSPTCSARMPPAFEASYATRGSVSLARDTRPYGATWGSAGERSWRRWRVGLSTSPPHSPQPPVARSSSHRLVRIGVPRRSWCEHGDWPVRSH